MLTCGVSHMNGRRRNATPVCENTRKRWWNPFSQPKHCSFLLWGFLVLSSIYNSKLLTNKKGNYKKLSVCGIVHLCLAQGVCHDVEGYGDPVPITPQVCIACMLHVGGEQGEGAWRCGDGVYVTGPPHRVAHVRGPDQACSNCFAQLYQLEQYFQQFAVSGVAEHTRYTQVPYQKKKMSREVAMFRDKRGRTERRGLCGVRVPSGRVKSTRDDSPWAGVHTYVIVRDAVRSRGLCRDDAHNIVSNQSQICQHFKKIENEGWYV